MLDLPRIIFAIRRQTLRNAYYWMCAGILCTYMAVTVIGMYRSWYIATAVTVAFTAFFVQTKSLRVRGALRAALPLVAYYFWLFLTALWAKYPEITIWHATTQLIFVVVFVLFYLLSRNFPVEDTTDFFIALTPPALAIFVLTYLADPSAQRFGGYAQAMLPFLFLFCLRRLIDLWHMRYMMLGAGCLLALVIGMSRAPLLIAGIGLALMSVIVAKKTQARVRLLTACIGMATILGLTTLLFQPLQLYAAKTLVRITRRDIHIAGQIVQKERLGVGRSKLLRDGLSLWRDNWLLGIGYMNFMPWFGDRYHYRYKTPDGREVNGISLHNSYETWAVEGGIPCVVIVLVMLREYFRILRRRIRRSQTMMERSYYQTYRIAMICLLITGGFHQIHQLPIFHVFLGIVYAFSGKEHCRRAWLTSRTSPFDIPGEDRLSGGSIEGCLRGFYQ